MSWLSYQEVERMVVELSEKASKNMTAVWNYISVYVSVKPLDIFNQTSAISTGLSQDKIKNQTKKKFMLCFT